MKQWKKSLLYTPKHTKPADKNLMRLLVPSIVGILICMVCLSGTTWAWFSASVQTGAQTITAANFNVEVAIDPTPVISEGGKYTLTRNTAYTVTPQEPQTKSAVIAASLIRTPLIMTPGTSITPRR